ncbi:protein translocase subunit SecD [Saccharibacillus brassicae]|uniref:Protein translocase subunit SecD n=1 Tax=Saccharibacillus brassicae TaxID=2583377 RepID=A0A4Y6UR24_SACBS|nr:protein translocase subunit SecD [Saccharibacillus brassicae]QDH20069.1 protein translocase subunit SecD [Saccharibacillus brassicae]
MKRIVSFIVIVLVSIGVMVWSTPNLLNSVRLGLDLKGGFEILYEASPMTGGAEVTRESLTETAKSLEKRVDALGGSEPEITTEGTNRIRLRIAGVTDEMAVRERIKEPANLTFRSMGNASETGAAGDTGAAAEDEAALEKTDPADAAAGTDKAAPAEEDTKTDAAAGTGTDETTGTDKAAGTDETTGTDKAAGTDEATGTDKAAGTETDAAKADPFQGYDKIELTGQDFKPNGASVQYTSLNEPMISIELNDPDKFAEVTGRLIGQPMAIFLDDELLSAPVVRDRITGGTAQISGDYSREEAQNLRDTINLGALPLQLTEKYSQSVGATLGQMSLDQTLRAGIVGSIIILIFMMFMYRIPGLIAAFCLIIHTWGTILVFIWADITLTLPGIAAFILGIGMAVDANVITYERIKEELRSGKSILSAFRAGSKSSFRTVMDAQITTLIAGAVMFWLGTGSVRGFALVLMIDIVTSIITNVFLSRFLLSLLVKAKSLKKPGYFGVKGSEIREL